jgi:hypothetical protein
VRDDAEHLVAEALVRDPFGRNQQQVDLIVHQTLHDRLESSGFVELIVSAHTSMRVGISIWLRISASRGDTSSVGPPAPCSRAAS